MFAENLKSIRKARGITQDELAIRLHVVRQTISKWEKGLSVPDAEMLIRIGEIFEISVSELLGTRIENEANTNEIAEQLARINEQLAIKNHRMKLFFTVLLVIIIGIIVLNIFLAIISMISLNSFENDKNMTITEQIKSIDDSPDYSDK